MNSNSKLLHKLSKDELVNYVEKIQENQLTADEIDYLCNLLISADKKIIEKLMKQKEMLRK